MIRYDDIVIGSGISGMTMSLILAMNGHKVLLIEKGPYMGGSMARFSKRGIPFDIGFHFTGGLHKGGILDDILSVLDMHDGIEPVFMSDDDANSFVFENDGKRYDMPYGIEKLKLRMKAYFPEEACGIDSYFDKVQNVCKGTPSMSLGTLLNKFDPLQEDYITCEEVLTGITANPVLKALFSTFAMCYGVKPNEISFANHSRISYGLYESVARVKNGGTAFIEAFDTKFRQYDVEVRCGCHITGMTEIRENMAGRFILNTGEEISATNCIFTIHPKEVLKVMPGQHVSKAFRERVSAFESSAGCFSIFGVLDPGFDEPGYGSKLVTLLPSTDFNQMLDPFNEGDSALILVKTLEQVGEKKHKVIVAIEPSFPEQVEAWKDSQVGRRPEAYKEYKEKKVEHLLKRIYKYFPGYRGKLSVSDAASVLTFRDYLHNNDGSSYGVKQKIGQFNLRGRLPVRNCYAAGQSSILPGVIGAMMSSLIVAQSLVKEDDYAKFLNRRLCR